MEKLLRFLIKINNIVGYLPSNVGQVVDVVIEELAVLFAPYRVMIFLTDIDSEREEMAREIDLGVINQKTECKAIREGLPVFSDSGSVTSVCPECPGVNYSVCLPVVAGKEVLGSLSLFSPVARPIRRDELEVLVSIVNQVGVAVQRSRLLKRLQQDKEALLRSNQDILKLNEELTALIKHQQSTQAQLIHSEKLAAAGRLAANLAHEINNPVGIILSRLDIVLWDLDESSQLFADLRVIQKQAQRIAAITQGMLSFTRKPSASKDRVGLNGLLAETVGWLDSQFQKQNIQVRTCVGEEVYVRGNREQLQQVLVNLLSNAKDAMPDGGLLTVGVKPEPAEGLVYLEVCDTGHGIAAEELERIFEPFYTSKDRGVGTGLGLYVTHSILKEHRGEIKVESRFKQGSKFTVILPIYSP